ncbi:MAG: TIGR03013 family PEP-CTERM/XrtA system glycosyltransferase [Gammaproteobacteria bacterium]|nr:MAG: TIGR03013 family PEP-CTERM/XrtA system glycosyltransferase [Gammaproteobacteria bacterium]
MYRIFGHYIPRALLVLGFCEGLILLLSVYIGTSFAVGSIEQQGEDLHPLVINGSLFIAVMLIAMSAMGLYRRDLRDRFLTISFRVFLSLLMGLTILFAFYLIYPESIFNSNVIFIGVVCSFLGILCSRVLWSTVSNPYVKKAIVIGAGEKAQLIEGLRRKSDLFGVEILGYINTHGIDNQSVVGAGRVVGNLHNEGFNLTEYLLRNNIDEIVIAMDERRANLPVNDILEVRMRGIQVIEVNTFMERQLGKIYLNNLKPSSFIFSDGFKKNSFKSINKRLLDIVSSLSILILTLPIWLLTILAILIESGGRGSIFYKQSRVGENNRVFNVLKFRSMREDAEQDGVARWASLNDNRVTRVGSFIRKTRIDELPQLFNVLKGDMSFVGPRPERPQFVKELAETIPFYSLRQHIKPGITGWAQICYPYGASINDAKEKLQYDLYYMKHHSIFLDLLILIQTVEVILFQKGSR